MSLRACKLGQTHMTPRLVGHDAALSRTRRRATTVAEVRIIKARGTVQEPKEPVAGSGARTQPSGANERYRARRERGESKKGGIVQGRTQET
eukprot:92471-Pleurochrysis_carterae.AAC.2